MPKVLSPESLAMQRRVVSDPRVRAWRNLPWWLRHAEMPLRYRQAMNSQMSQLSVDAIEQQARTCCHFAGKVIGLVDALAQPEIEVVLDGRRISHAAVETLQREIDDLRRDRTCWCGELVEPDMGGLCQGCAQKAMAEVDRLSRGDRR